MKTTTTSWLWRIHQRSSNFREAAIDIPQPSCLLVSAKAVGHLISVRALLVQSFFQHYQYIHPWAFPPCVIYQGCYTLQRSKVLKDSLDRRHQPRCTTDPNVIPFELSLVMARVYLAQTRFPSQPYTILAHGLRSVSRLTSRV